MASLYFRLTYAALGAALLTAPQAAWAQDGADATPAAQTAPAPQPTPRPLDDDSYPAPAASSGEAVPSAPVNRPPPGAAVQSAPQMPPQSPPMSSPAPSASAEDQRMARPEHAEPQVRLSVEGRVVADSRKSRPIKVGKGDTVNVICERLHTPKDDLIKLNKLKKPYELELGRVIEIPTPKAYVVQSGDTLYAIAKRFGVSADVLAEINDVDVEDRVKSGQKVALPTDVHDGGPVRTVIAPARPSSRLSNRYAVISGETVAPPTRPDETLPPAESGGGTGPGPHPYASPYASHTLPPSRMTPPSSTYGAPVVEASPAPSDSQITAAGRGKFGWPVSGTLISGFGPKPGGQRNDGLDIAATLGSPVTASAAGDVVYAGNVVPGFGTLVLIKHEDGWVTAYAHLSRTEVKIKDHVHQGDEIGQVGQTGGVDQPQLHFEIRYAPTPKDKARPIDPTLVLPPAQ